jgi:hypothetical protein
MSIEFGDDFLGLDLVNPDVDWGLGLVNAEGPWGLGDDLDATVSADDGLGDVGCGCGLGAAPDAKAKGGKPAKSDESSGGFPVGAVVAGVGGLALGIGAVLLIRKYVFKRKTAGAVAGLSGYYGRRARRGHHGRRR